MTCIPLKELRFLIIGFNGDRQTQIQTPKQSIHGWKPLGDCIAFPVRDLHVIPKKHLTGRIRAREQDRINTVIKHETVNLLLTAQTALLLVTCSVLPLKKQTASGLHDVGLLVQKLTKAATAPTRRLLTFSSEHLTPVGTYFTFPTR